MHDVARRSHRMSRRFSQADKAHAADKPNAAAAPVVATGIAATPPGVRIQLVGIGQAPQYLRGNPFILSGYRRSAGATPRDQAIDLLHSLFMWHNETINIWLHVVGFLLFASLAAIAEFGSLPHLRAAPPTARHALAGFWMAAGAVCLGSSGFHLFNPLSARMHRLLAVVDYAGIILLISATCAVGIIYGHGGCAEYDSQVRIALGGTVLLALAMLYVVANPSFATPTMTHYRTAALVTYGLGGVYVPLSQAWTALGAHSGRLESLVASQFPLSIGIILAAAALYAAKLPERLAPAGRFALGPHGHQLLHVATVVSPLIMGWMLEDMARAWHAGPPPRCRLPSWHWEGGGAIRRLFG